jgi:hypothetical protein
MKRIALFAAMTVIVASALGAAVDLTKVAIPDEDAAALKALKDWMTARGFEVEDRTKSLLIRRNGLLMTLTPIVSEKDLDRFLVSAFYTVKDEFKGKPEFVELAAKLNAAQNFVKVFVDSDGDLAIQGNLTFYDEITARHFDSCLDYYTQVVRTFVLTDEAVAMLK